MPWGIIGGAVIGAAGSAIAGSEQASGQKAAAGTQQAMFNTINSQEQPFMQAGYGATTRLQDLLGISGNKGADGYGSLTSNFTPTDFLNNMDPGYGFQLEQGQQAIRNQDTPTMGALSGAALKDLIGFNQGMASTAYGNAFNRFQSQQNNIFARLSGIAGLGQNAASNTGVAGTSLGTGIAQAQAGAAGSIAGGIVGATNSLGQGSTLAALLNQGGGGYNSNNNPGAWDTETPGNFQDFSAGG